MGNKWGMAEVTQLKCLDMIPMDTEQETARANIINGNN